MKRVIAMLIVALTLVLPSILNADPLDGDFKFAGLWQGVDPTDGSEALRSIIRNRDGTYEVIGSETYFSGCNGGRGIVTANGLNKDGILTLDKFTLECYGGDKFVGNAQFTPDKESGIIKESYEGGTFSPVILHRISK
jgi:hypothetical protein